MNQPLARSILVLFATSALGACATPTYATSLAPSAMRDGDTAAALVRGTDSAEARLAPAVERGDGSAALVLAATHRRHHHVAAKAAVPADEEADDGPATYKVRSGDTLGKIADRLGVSLADLKSANHIKGTAIDVGQVLKIPGGAAPKTTKAAAKSPKAAAAEEAESDAPATYNVRNGDTLGKISDKLGVSVAELKAANHIKGTAIDVGQVLKVPGKAPTTKAATRAEKAERAEPETPATYKVRRGDTLFSISKKFGVSMDDLRAANGLSAHGSIHAGQTLKLVADERGAEAPVRTTKTAARRHAAEEDTAAGEEGQAAGRVIEVEGPATTYRVRKGDTLEKVADKLDTDIARLKKDNHLKSSAIRPGQVLKGPRTTRKAYVARSGDTLPEVARRFGVSTERLRATNGLSRRATIRSGQKLVLPAGYRDHGAFAAPVREPERTPTRYTPRPQLIPEPAPTTSPDEASAPQTPGTTNTTPPSTPRPYTPYMPYTPTPSAPRPYSAPSVTNGPPLAPTATPPPTDAQISELGRGRFQWPIKGDIVSDFGPKTPGQRNDGINIRGNLGDPVRAAAAGDVVYAGDQVPGFGNLVLIKHADGWVTAYGHLSKVEVKMQQKILQGQEIGQVGTTGGVTEPQLHFEVRFAPNALDRARPVDPKLVLPK